MITLRKSGAYKLIETRRNIKILYLGRTAYAWVESWPSKEILVASHNPHITDCVLSVGDYWLYDLDHKPHAPGKQFLVLAVGNDVQQGYLLLTGLPTNQRKRVRIIATHMVITDNPAYSNYHPTRVGQSKDKRKEEIHEVSSSL